MSSSRGGQTSRQVQSTPRRQSTVSSLSRTAAEAGMSSATKAKVREAQRHTVHKAEMEQLSTFIKKRSQVLEDEISDMQQKFRSTDRGREALAAASTARPRRTGSVENDSLEHVAEFGDLHLQGTGLGKVQLQPKNLIQESKRAAPKLAQASQTLENIRFQQPPDTDQLVTLLAKLKLKSEDAGFAPRDLMQHLLASDLSIPGEYWIPIEELTEVLQTDLLLPLTKLDQRLLVHEYGDSSGNIDVRGLLLDAGLWDEAESSSFSPTSPNVFGETRDLPDAFSAPVGDGLVAPARLKSTATTEPVGRRPPLPASDTLRNRSLASYPAPTTIPDEALSQTAREKKLLSDSGQVLQESTRNLEDLHRLHEQIMEDALFDDADNPKNSRLTGGSPSHSPLRGVDIVPPTSPVRPDPRAAINVRNSNTLRGQPLGSTQTSPSPSPLRSGKLPPSAENEEEHRRLRELVEENQKLKSEIGHFDSEFFEQLEDLKFRYARMQEVLGEDPLLRARVASTFQDTKLPLNKLAWSVRKSMTAMDRASYDSPLVQGPRTATAYTYAPGSQSDYLSDHEAHRQHLGGSLSASQGDRQSLLLDMLGRGNPAKPSIPGVDQVRAGGIHGIGAGSYLPSETAASAFPASAHDTQDFTGLCERRLAFELSNLPKPDDAILSLLTSIYERGDHNAAEEVQKGESLSKERFITVSQLLACFQAAGLSFSLREVEVLALGFASNAKGGIHCEELCHMVQSIAYNLLGHYARSYRPERGHGERTERRGAAATSYRRPKGAEEGAERQTSLTEDRDFQQVLRELCDAIITFDKRSVLGASSNFYQTLLKPFVEVDHQGKGWIHVYEWEQVLRELGAMLSAEEYAILARPFLLLETRAESAYPSSNLNHITSFREAKVTGSLAGHAKLAKDSGRFADFLASHGLASHLPTSDDPDRQIVEKDSMVDYVDFVEVLSRTLDQMVENKGGLPVVAKLPWIMKEFDLVDVLLSQLEAMKSTGRRKTLITLQYALENADSRETGELDGFAILTALINCGFRLQRYERVQLLRAAEEYGGSLDYTRLVLVLLQTTIDWSQSEREIVLKVLRAMGVTVEQRRHWLARLKKDLLERSAQQKRKLIAKERSSSSSSKAAWASQEAATASAAGSDRSFDIPPAVFLHVLRDLHVELSPEEEAILLDCLDTERMAKLQAKKLLSHLPTREARSSASSSHRIAWTSSHNHPNHSAEGTGEFSLPSVDYQSFVTFCARHCGSWMDSHPDLYEALYSNLRSLRYPLMALQEYLLLCSSFDELNTGYISVRAFLICGNRSTLFAQTDETALQRLAQQLAVEGAGEIEFRPFCLQLRGMCAAIQQEQNAHLSLHGSGMSIIQQLLTNASSAASSSDLSPTIQQFLLPLRKWLLCHSDVQSLLLTLKDFNALLREFSVLYRPEDLDLLFLEIGYDLDARQADALASQRLSRHTAQRRENDWSTPRDGQHRVRVISTKKLLTVLNQHRSCWVDRHPQLARQLKKDLLAIPVEASSLPADHPGRERMGETSQGQTQIALAVLKVVSRLEAFSVSLAHLDDETLERDDEDKERIGLGHRQDRSGTVSLDALDVSQQSLLAKHPLTTSPQSSLKLIEMDVFDYLLRSMGIYLHKSDLLFLADASDPHPEANFINIYLLFDLLRRETSSSTTSEGGERDGYALHGAGEREEREAQLSDAARYALDHLRSMIWKVNGQLASGASVSIDSTRRGSNSSLLGNATSSSRKEKGGDGQKASTNLAMALQSSAPMASGRTPLEWVNDVKCIFQGFDAYGNGLISLQDFILALHCLGIKMSLDLIRDMSPYVGPSPTGPVQYKRILSYVLSAPLASSASASGPDREDDGMGGRDLLGTASSRGKSLASSKKREKDIDGNAPANQAVSRLLHAVRRNICIKQLILHNQHLEEAWMELLRVFQTFDPHEHNRVSARDFCLAVAVLLNPKTEGLATTSSSSDKRQGGGGSKMGSDDLILSRAEWEQVIDYFSVATTSSQGRTMASKQATNTRGELLLVDYMLFCEMVLDPKEVHSRVKDLQNHPDVRQLRMEYAKENLLSKKPSLSTTTASSASNLRSERGRPSSAGPRRPGGARDGMASYYDQQLDSARSNSRSLNRKFYGYDEALGTSRMGATTRGASSPGRPVRDEIAEKFSRAQNVRKHGTAFGRTYNGTGDLSEKSTDSANRRAGHTLGQASREHAQHTRAVHSGMAFSNTVAGAKVEPLSHFSTQNLYDSSHDRTRKVRFNWTVG